MQIEGGATVSVAFPSRSLGGAPRSNLRFSIFNFQFSIVVPVTCHPSPVTWIGNKRSWLSVLMALLALVAASGCTRAPGGKTVFRYSGPGYKLYDKFRYDQGMGFAALHPEWRLDVRYETVTGTRYPDKIVTMAVAKQSPDVFIVYGASAALNWGKRGILLDLKPFIEADGGEAIKDVNPLLVDDYTVDGKIYALPGNCNVSALYYNKKCFDDAGLPYPDDTWTWETLLATARKLTKRDASGRAEQYGLIGAQGLWRDFLKQNNSDLWSKDKTQCLITRPEAVETFQFLRDLMLEHRVTPSQAETLQERGQESFMAGRGAMFLGGRWYTSFFLTSKTLDWHVAPLPKGKRRATAIASMSWGAWAHTPNPQVAYEFVKYMTREEAIKYLFDIGDALPTRNTAETREYMLNEAGRPKGENQAYVDAFGYAYSLKDFIHPKINQDEQDKILTEELEKIWLGLVDVPTGLRGIEKRLMREVEKGG